MPLRQREAFLRVSIYATLACALFVVSKNAWIAHALIATHGRCNTTFAAKSVPSPFGSLATLHLPFAALAPQVVHLGIDALPDGHLASSGSSQIGKCTVMHGKYGPGGSPGFNTHLRHSEIHHYPIFVLDRPLVDGLWTKEAALLAVLLHEMAKPDYARLQWLMWFDADTLVINPLIAVETFLPTHDLDGVNLLVTEDWNGLNNGVFLLRVNAWSVNMLTNVLSYPSFKPDEKLPFTEQSAMERMIQDPRFASGCIYVPPRWFNSYPRSEDEAWNKYHVEKGDMMLHFAGVGDRPRMMRAFLDRVIAERNSWEIAVAKMPLADEVAGFWNNVRMQRQTGL